jgi:ABC-2 type transport system permease protein
VSSTFQRLLKLELQETLRQPLTWAVFSALFVAMLVGAAIGAARVEREENIVHALAREQAKALSESTAAAQRYATPSDLKIDYHRDPTDAFGYMNYFLVTHAVKPPLRLGALAVGQADIHPIYVRIDFNSIFPDAVYDLRNPHELRMGAFDFAFVLIYLVPLGLIALTATRLTGEQDSGILRLIAAQPIGPATVAAAKYSAIGLTSIVCVVGAAALALALQGQLALSPQLALVGIVVCLWVSLWIALAAYVATLWRGAIGSIITLMLVWGAMTLLLPAAAALLVEAIHPPPSRIGYIDSSRQATDSFYGNESERQTAWLARLPEFAAASPEIVNSAEVKRFARDYYYRQALLPQRELFEAHARAVLNTSDRLRLLSPAMMLDGMLQTVAGTDLRRHTAFIAAADAYSETLRRYFEPLTLSNAANSTRSCRECPGRLNFTRYHDVPTFEPDTDLSTGLRWSLWTSLYLATLVSAIGLIARRRLREWPL